MECLCSSSLPVFESESVLTILNSEGIDDMPTTIPDISITPECVQYNDVVLYSTAVSGALLVLSIGINIFLTCAVLLMKKKYRKRSKG